MVVRPHIEVAHLPIYFFAVLPGEKTRTGVVAAARIFLHVHLITEKGKPGERRGHKITGLRVFA
jgi:hypothetical protein